MEDHKQRRETERRANTGDVPTQDDEYAPTVFFVAGTALVALFLKRAVFIDSILGKQWHAWVFLLLNIILLAILFTSRHPVPDGSESRGTSCLPTKTGKPTRKRRPRAKPVEVGCDPDEGKTGEEDGVARKFSDEELTERVESFIAAFRQHLVLDGRRR